MTTQWEYLELNGSSGGGFQTQTVREGTRPAGQKPLVDMLDELGQDGWELCAWPGSIESGYPLIFKRPKDRRPPGEQEPVIDAFVLGESSSPGDSDWAG